MRDWKIEKYGLEKNYSLAKKVSPRGPRELTLQAVRSTANSRGAFDFATAPLFSHKKGSSASELAMSLSYVRPRGLTFFAEKMGFEPMRRY